MGHCPTHNRTCHEREYKRLKAIERRMKDLKALEQVIHNDGKTRASWAADALAVSKYLEGGERDGTD